ncbi:hypothetical protein IV203_029639 [Nitzschia inconspicua]|uniref:Uncharacterized protein n=1 Tax=Nitzschia inconspicua TaxID=303405 RepID=A0A9K3LS78_9STRA|nr:hypothetical protein IV203_029639 [Nitzschia inconspicua]
MGDDIAKLGLQAFEELAAGRSFGQAGLHTVRERPLIRDTRRKTATSLRERPTATLCRNSLMNERTRIGRTSDAGEEKRTHRRHSSMRKRKSDELGGVDLSDLDTAEYSNSDEVATSAFQQSKSPNDNLGSVLFPMNSGWPKTLQQTIARQDDDDDLPIHYESGAGSIFANLRKDVDPRSETHTKGKAISDIRFTAPTPKTPLFQHYRRQSSSSHESDSPCSVAALTRGCGACFWERSLAWSEDEEDDEDGIVHPTLTNKAKDIRDHLSVPKHLGREYAETHELRKSTSDFPAHVRRPSSSRVVTLESDSRHKIRGAKMFRQTDVDKVTEIHWEEKVLETTALDLMAKLSL